jgi:hypothetical protein
LSIDIDRYMAGLFESSHPPLTGKKRGNVGTPHTPPRGGCPLEPCFVRLSKSHGYMSLSFGQQKTSRF